MLIVVLVQVLIVLTASLFNSLSLEIDELKYLSSKTLDLHQALIGLDDLKRKHFVLCRLVDRINQCFGLVTLLAMLRGFISIMVGSYNLVIFDSIRNGLDIKIYSWATIAFETFYLLLPIGAAWYLSFNV